MHYPLINRYKATLLGALLGEVLAKDAEQQYHICSDISSIGVIGTKSLIELGKLDINNWLERHQKKYLKKSRGYTKTEYTFGIHKPSIMWLHGHRYSNFLGGIELARII